MLAHVHHDVAQVPALADVVAPWESFVEVVRDGLREGGAASQPARVHVAAAVAPAAIA
jgi:hypothetical protein